jgi:hypothetical protein
MATLPDVPRGKELEDFVAALLQCTGYFIEKNIEERNVLELDIVASTYDAKGPTRQLFEVKEGSAQFSDISKVLGWMKYLNIDRGAFVSAQAPDKPLEFFVTRCEQVGMKFVLIGDHENAASIFAEAGFGAADPGLHSIWRFSLWVERNLLEGLRRFQHAHPEMEAPLEALNYYRLINNGIFFTRDVVDRINLLYKAFQAHPHLTAAAAEELHGGTFDCGTIETQAPQMQAAFRHGRHILLQACMYLEHRARLSLLKAAVDYLSEGGAVRENLDGTIRIDFRVASLPQTFLQGLSRLRSQPSYQKYPLFWQAFLWGWGGLIVVDREEDDLIGLSEQTGMSPDEARTALSAFDWLFPIPNGWLYQMPTAAYRLTKLVPWPFQGLGAWQRLVRSGQTEYSDLGLSGQYTGSDLANRHNSCVRLLEGELEFEPSSAGPERDRCISSLMARLRPSIAPERIDSLHGFGFRFRVEID